VGGETHVRKTFARTANVADAQNAGDPDYRPMRADLQASVAFQTASEYTEHVLHRRCRELRGELAAQASKNQVG